MAKNKTGATNEDVAAFINSFADTEQKRNDSFALLSLMEKVTGFKPVMWGPFYHRVRQLSLQIRKWPRR